MIYSISTKRQSKNRSGMSLIEVIVGSAIVVSALVAIMGTYGGLTGLSLRNTPKIQAAMLLEEGSEILRLMRDTGWSSKISSLSNGTTYRFIWQNNAWTSTTSVQMIDSFFDRTFVLSAVNRDASYNIVTSGGTLDTGTRKATITVSWRDGNATTSRSVELYIYNTFNN